MHRIAPDVEIGFLSFQCVIPLRSVCVPWNVFSCPVLKLALAAIVAATVAIPSLISTGRYVDLLVYLHLCTGCSENHKHSLND